jgi:hypothetical protein
MNKSITKTTNCAVTTGANNMYYRLKQLANYVPRRLHIAWLMLFFVPLSANAAVKTDAGIFEYLTSLTEGIGKLKTFAWILGSTLGVLTFIYGLGMLAMINLKPDYRGKATNGFCFKLMIIGAVVASGAVFYGMIANSAGATDAVSNAQDDGFNGFN